LPKSHRKFTFQGEAKFSEEKASLDAVKENTAKVKELAACLQKQNENTLRDKEARRIFNLNPCL